MTKEERAYEFVIRLDELMKRCEINGSALSIITGINRSDITQARRGPHMARVHDLIDETFWCRCFIPREKNIPFYGEDKENAFMHTTSLAFDQGDQVFIFLERRARYVEARKQVSERANG